MIRLRWAIALSCARRHSLTLALVALLGACSGSNDPEHADTDGGAFEPIEGMEGRTDLTALAPEDLIVIQAAETRLIAECMEAEGFDYQGKTPAEYVSAMPPYLSPAELRRSGYSYDWAAAAAEFLGSNSQDGSPPQTISAEEDLDRTEMTLSPEQAARQEAKNGGADAEQVRLQGPGGGTTSASTEGCVADARRTLYGSVANALRYDRAVTVLSLSGIVGEVREIDEYQAPRKAWQDCMRAAGHDVTDNSDYGGYWLQQQGMVALSEDGEGQTAVTADLIQAVAEDDADCQESSGLYEVRKELLPKAREQAATDLGLTMTQYIQFQHAVLERAKEVP